MKTTGMKTSHALQTEEQLKISSIIWHASIGMKLPTLLLGCKLLLLTVVTDHCALQMHLMRIESNKESSAPSATIGEENTNIPPECEAFACRRHHWEHPFVGCCRRLNWEHPFFPHPVDETEHPQLEPGS